MAPPDRPSSRRLVRARTRPPAEPDLALHRLVGLDETGMPGPDTSIELSIDDPELAYEIRVERCAAHATANLLHHAVEQVDKVMGEGSAHAYPEITAAFVRSATAIRNQDLWRAHTVDMMRRGRRP